MEWKFIFSGLVEISKDTTLERILQNWPLGYERVN